jgi:hypothetical protein
MIYLLKKFEFMLLLLKYQIRLKIWLMPYIEKALALLTKMI